MAIETVSMAWIKSNTKNTQFFSPGAMAFFKCRLPNAGKRNGDDVFFYTSEQYTGEPRRFTLRRLDLITGHVSTVGNFQAYATMGQATKAMMAAAHHQPVIEPEEVA